MRLVLFIFFITISASAAAQRDTHVGVGAGLISSRYQLDENLSIRSPTTINGGSYDFVIRQEITKFLSAEIGYSWRGYDSEYLLPGDSYAYPNISMWAHIIPIKLDIGVDVVRDRISLYGSFGYHICVQQYTGSGSQKSFNSEGDSIILEWEYIAESEHNSLFTVGIGSRFRIVDQLHVDLELEYAFGFKEQRAYHFTYWDDAGEPQNISTTYNGNYWRCKLGISYPVQRVLEMLRVRKRPIAYAHHRTAVNV